MTASPDGRSLRSMLPADLPTPAKWLLVGVAGNALGSGLTMPFLFVYLSEVRGIPTTTIGLLFSAMGLLGFMLAPIAGTLIDRFGPRAVMLVCIVAQAGATASISQVHDVTSAFLVQSCVVAAGAGLWPGQTALMTRLVRPDQREKMYGFQFMLLNAGLGVGGMLSASLVDPDRPVTFERLYWMNGASYLIPMVILALMPRGTGRLTAALDRPTAGTAASPTGGWGEVLKDKVLLRVVLASVITSTFGYAQFEAGMAAYATTVADLDPRVLGWAFGANTAVIVLAQVFALRAIRGRRRSRMLALCAGIWSASWLLMAACDWVGGWYAAAALIAGLGLFGVGETLWAPLAPAVVNDLAREELRGRYNALQGMTWTVSGIIGPMVAGMLIGHGMPGIWVASTVGGTALAAVMMLRLCRHLTDAQDGLVPAGASPTPVAVPA